MPDQSTTQAASPRSSTDYFEPISMDLFSESRRAFGEAVCRSFRQTGFAVIADHGLDQTVIDAALEDAKTYFDQSETVKQAHVVPNGAGQRGYTPFGVEAAKGAAQRDLKEFWHVGRRLPEGHPYSDVMPPNVGVASPERFDHTTYDLFLGLEALGLKILSAIAIELGLIETYFDDATRDGNSILRLLHYPPQTEPPPEGSVRAGAHEDINVITLLLGAEESGLQVKHASGDWLSVSPPPGSLVINCGDMLQRLTNHDLPSTTHRVVNPRPERAAFPRYSTPFFLHFRPDFIIETLPSCISDARPNAYPEPISAHDYLLERLREIKLM